MAGITPRHGKNRPHGECEIGGSCEKSHELAAYGSRLWPHIWPCYAVPGAWPCGGDTGGVTSAVRHEAAGLQQPDRRSCGHGRRGLAIRGGGGEYEGAFPRKRRLETPFVRSTHRGAPAAIDCTSSGTRRAITWSVRPHCRGQPRWRWSRPERRRCLSVAQRTASPADPDPHELSKV